MTWRAGSIRRCLLTRAWVAALEAQARKATVHVTVDGDHAWRGPEDAEAAAYFCCLEALQNVAKYAGAARADVRIRQDDGMLAFEVTDDGAGFDTVSHRPGDRTPRDGGSALRPSGTLDITSSPGAGTTVRGWIPLERSVAV